MRRLALSALAAAIASPAFAAGPIQADHPWIRATPPGAMTAAGYVVMTNKAATTDQLLGGSSPAARSVTAHQTLMQKGVMRMSAVASLPLVPGQPVTFSPGGGYHLMLVGLTKPLAVGQKVPVTLNFQKAGAVTVQFTVEQPPAPMGGMAMDHAHH